VLTYFSDFWVLFRAIFDKSIVLNVHDENYPKLDVLVDRQQAKRLNVLNNWSSKDEPILLFTNSGNYEMFNFYLLLYTFLNLFVQIVREIYRFLIKLTAPKF
jgi:hypothetical protein